MPGEREQSFFQFGEPPLGRADQIGDRRIGRAHLGKHLLGRNAAIHHPDAVGLAVLGFDLAQDAAQRGLVGGVPRQHLVAERKTLGRHDQRNHHLHAVAALVAAVAVAALVGFVVRRRRLEIGARQVVQQHIEPRPEQVLPALTKMREQRLFVWQQLVQAPVERILLRQRKISAEQIGHRALLEPLPVQAPLAARIDQPITHQRLQDVPPARTFA